MTPESASVANLSIIDVAADVVVDMFLDPNPQTANSTTMPKYEVMIWFATFGGRTPSKNPRFILKMTELISMQSDTTHP